MRRSLAVPVEFRLGVGCCRVWTDAKSELEGVPLGCWFMTQWEYATVPLLVHATKQILDQWGEDGWELVTVLPGPNPENLVAYLKRPKGQ
jgi:hypothetical protein